MNIPIFNPGMSSGVQPHAQAPPPQRSYREAAWTGCRRYAPNYSGTANRSAPRYQVPNLSYNAPLNAWANTLSTSRTLAFQDTNTRPFEPADAISSPPSSGQESLEERTMWNSSSASSVAEDDTSSRGRGSRRPSNNTEKRE